MLLNRAITVSRVTVTKRGIFGRRKVLELTDEEGRIGLAFEGGAVEIATPTTENEPRQLFSLSNYDVEYVPKHY
ncbi:MAG: hypothetical protein Q8N73_01300 [bacterium]|nr:hypothetical protein [bacterium]